MKSESSTVLVVSPAALVNFEKRGIKVLHPPVAATPNVGASVPLALEPAEDALPWLASLLSDKVEALVERRVCGVGESPSARPDATAQHLVLIESDDAPAPRAQVLETAEQLVS